MKFDKARKTVYPVVNTVIRILLLLIAAGLCLQSMFSTSFIGRIVKEDGSSQERTLNIADAPWKHLLVFLGFTLLGIIVYSGYGILREWIQSRQALQQSAGGRQSEAVDGGERDGRRSGTCESPGCGSHALWICSGIVLIVGTIWILATQLAPGSDPAKVFSIAMQWRRGDFSSYAEGGYLFRYPFQAGIILFYYLLSFLFGMDNYIGPQFVNLAALMAVYMLLAKLSAFFWRKDRKLPVLVHIALILWVPLGFYITYLYGILPGMALSLGAVYATAKYIETRKYRYILPACICMGLATVIKMNCLIYLIAIACFLFYDALDIALLTRKDLGKRWIVSILMVGLMILSVAGCNKATERYVAYLSGYEAGDGEAMISWVVMGLQETPLGPGGYSGYIAEVFLRHDYDTEKIKENSLADIRKILTRMSENVLDDGIPFFARKNAFQWNDPTFISLDRTRGRTPAADVPDFAVSLIEGRGSVALSVILNYMQTLLLLGVLLYLMFSRSSRNLYELLGAVVFLGGYLFHFVWESSASYTIPYFVILIPYAVKGLVDYIRFMTGLPGRIRRSREEGIEAGAGKMLRRHKLLLGGGALILVLFVLVSRRSIFDRTIALDDGEEARIQFYRENAETGYLEQRKQNAQMAGIRNGYYYLSPYKDQQQIVVEEDGKVTLVSLEETAEEMTQMSEKRQNHTEKSSGREEKQAVIAASRVSDIGHKVLLNSEKSSGGIAGISIRFRSNEQVMAVETKEAGSCLTVYLEDGMNLLHETRDTVSYRWKFRRAGQEGYYITIDDMALTLRDGEVTLEELRESEEQIWVLQQ